MSSFHIHLAEIHLQRAAANHDFAQRQRQRTRHQRHADGEQEHADNLPLKKQRAHRHGAGEQAGDAEHLHPADEFEADAQVVNLRLGERVGTGLAFAVQPANQRGEVQETVGVCQQQQADGGKQQGRRGQFQVHDHSRGGNVFQPEFLAVGQDEATVCQTGFVHFF